MRFFTALVLVFGLLGCKSKDIDSGTTGASEKLGLAYKNSWIESGDHITFMTFNVENLFDTEDDAGKDDATFLPLTKKQSDGHKKNCATIKNDGWRDQCLNWDWSDKVVDHKLKVLSEAIAQVKNGKGPDILVLQEVENINILNRLNNSGLGYKTAILIDGADKRGIDVAILSRLPQFKTAQLHPIPFKGVAEDRVADTRGILQVDLKLPNDDIVSVFAVHFPAPFHPTEMREQAFDHLNRLQKNLPRGRLALAGGDFNVPHREDTEKDIVNGKTKDTWIVGHKVGCGTCPGTNYYAPLDSWSFLDMVMWSKNFEEPKSKWTVLKDSVRIYNSQPEQTTPQGGPNRYEYSGPSGVSDHWPLAVDLKLKK
jgi:endonuclease/exonuclease/phosphatase family metal-dependent hydrolase